MQGAGAAVRIATALAAFDADPDVDVIVLARGGGSVEDLLPFSSEAVCRAVCGVRHAGGLGRSATSRITHSSTWWPMSARAPPAWPQA